MGWWGWVGMGQGWVATDGEGLVIGGNRMVMVDDSPIKLYSLGTVGVRRGVITCWGLGKSE